MIQKSLKNHFKIPNQVEIHLDYWISLEDQIWAIRSCTEKPLILSFKVGMNLSHWISIGSYGCHPSAPFFRPSDQASVKTARWISQNSQIALRGPCASPMLHGPPHSSANQSVPLAVKFSKYPSDGPSCAAKNADVILTSALHR